MILKSRGTGRDRNFKKIGKNVVIEPTALIFEADKIEIGDNVYIGHNVMLHGYYLNEFTIGSNVFISAGCNIYGSCGLTIEDNVGIGPNVTILGTSHDLTESDTRPVNHLRLVHNPIVIGEGTDIGAGSTIVKGKIGKGVQVGAGAVVVDDIDNYLIVVGVPAKPLRSRNVSKSTV